MGNSLLCPVKTALKELLKTKGLKIKSKVLETFLQEVDTIAPWFAISGQLTLASWDKLGRDLDFAWGQGSLRGGVREVWKLVRSCLDSERCQTTVRATEDALEQVKEQRSEGSRQGKQDKGKGRKLYPSLSELETSSESSGSSSEEEEEMERLEEDLESLLIKMEEMSVKQGRKRGRKKAEGKGKGSTPTAPPWPDIIAPKPGPPPYAEAPRGSVTRTSFCPQTWREAAVAFPVFEDPNTQIRYHEVLRFKQLKELVESVKTYGINASFTQAQLERLTQQAMTPADWMSTVKACLSMGQYLDWKSIYQDYAQQQARANAVNGQVHWNYDMLVGQGQWVNNQTAYPLEVYGQINSMAVKAWKALPNKGEISGNLTKIIQGSTEPFSDFVARMVEAAGRIFGDSDTAMPLIEQLIFEQCTKECRNAITPWKSKGLQAWMKACREIGGPLSNAGLAAAVMQLTKGKGSTPGACFSCGRQGHLKKQCPEKGKKQSGQPGPGLCPRCKKGNHWAKECRSVKDINGQPLTSGYGGARPKNGQRGPRFQGPQMYGAMENQSAQKSVPSLRPPRDGRHQDPQGWTSVAPPESY